MIDAASEINFTIWTKPEKFKLNRRTFEEFDDQDGENRESTTEKVVNKASTKHQSKRKRPEDFVFEF
jgi:hypothetical protein